MKRRFGFVSNSSSSSFIVGVKKIPETPEEKKILLEEIKSAIRENWNPDYIIEEMAKLVLGPIMDCKFYEPEYEWSDIAASVAKKGFTFFRGSASTEDYELSEQLLVDVEIKYESDDLVIDKDASF